MEHKRFNLRGHSEHISGSVALQNYQGTKLDLIISFGLGENQLVYLIPKATDT